MGVCMVGWAHSPFGRLDDLDIEALITSVSCGAIAHAGISNPGLAGVFNMGGSIVTNYVTVLERLH